MKILNRFRLVILIDSSAWAESHDYFFFVQRNFFASNGTKTVCAAGEINFVHISLHFVYSLATLRVNAIFLRENARHL